ncbi:MAG: glycosyl hydrolase family 18 protein [Candidatus Paceibacterota bacterium]
MMMNTTTVPLPNATQSLRVALAFLFLVAILGMPSAAEAARHNLEYSGWVPWWQSEDGAERAEDMIRKLDTVYPFVYEVATDGSLVLKSDLDEDHWEDLFDEADDRGVEVIPTIAWFDGANIHRILSDDDLREDHIDEIVEMVEDGDFDGVNIDYESKLAATIHHYSEFLEELKDELDGKLLTCTIEPRTPPASRYREVPRTLEYANDYEAMAEHCDRVEIMAYDQQRIDWRLNDAKSGQPYIPVADVDWVEKVVELALEDIPANKLVLGVPTYGRNWTVQVAPNWYKEYTGVSAVNMPDAEAIAEDYDKEPGRNKAGELSFSYFPESSIFKVLESLPTPEGTAKGNEAAAKALLFANYTGMTVPVNVVWYSDAKAIEDKIDLAKKYALRGVALFKIDGEEDSGIWDLI